MTVPPLGPGHGQAEPRKPGDPGEPVTVLWAWSEPLKEWIGTVDKSPAKITARIWIDEVGLAQWEITNGEANQQIQRRGTTYRQDASATVDQAKLDIEEVINLRWTEWETGKPKLNLMRGRR